MGLLQRLFKREERETSAASRGSSKEDALAAYIVREHKLGRSIEEILEDPYLKNRASEEQRRRLLERPEVIHAIGEHTAAMARERIT